MRRTDKRFSMKLKLNYDATRWPEKEQAELQRGFFIYWYQKRSFLGFMFSGHFHLRQQPLEWQTPLSSTDYQRSPPKKAPKTSVNPAMEMTVVCFIGTTSITSTRQQLHSLLRSLFLCCFSATPLLKAHFTGFTNEVQPTCHEEQYSACENIWKCLGRARFKGWKLHKSCIM